MANLKIVGNFMRITTVLATTKWAAKSSPKEKGGPKMTTTEGITSAAAVRVTSVIQPSTHTLNKSIIRWHRQEQTTPKTTRLGVEEDLASLNRSTIWALLWGMSLQVWAPMTANSNRSFRKTLRKICSRMKQICFLRCTFRRRSLKRREVWRLYLARQQVILL